MARTPEPNPKKNPGPIIIKSELALAICAWTRQEYGHRLNCVMFRNGTYTATDGHHLVVGECQAPHQAGISSRHIIAAVAAQRVIGSASDVLHIDRVEDHPGIAEIRFDDVSRSSFLSVPISTDYPSAANIEGAFPPPEPKGTPEGYVLNARFLADMAAIQRASGHDPRNAAVRVMSWTPGALGAISFADKHARFAIMPINPADGW